MSDSSVVLDLTFDLKSRGNTESHVKSTTLAEHGVKIFRCGESAPANFIIRKNDQAFVDSTRAFGLNAAGQEKGRARCSHTALRLAVVTSL
jgi:hypothetical protein